MREKPGERSAALASLRRAWLLAEPQRAMPFPATIAERAAQTMATPRFLASMLVAFALLALALAAAGIYGAFTFLVAMRQLRRMGPLEGLLGLLPGVGKQLRGIDMDPDRLKRIEAIVLSMTPEERRHPKVLNGSRRKRIARGSGTTVQEVNRLLKQFEEMNRMMKRLRGTLRGR